MPKPGPVPAASSSPRDQDRLVAGLVNALQDRISTGDIKIGSWIRQERIAQEYGVSRTPVREALRQLDALGVVEIVANRGARVKLPSIRDITEAFEVRGVLEGHAACLAARNITQAQLDVLRETDGIFREAVRHARSGGEDSRAESRALWYRANDAFHATIVTACGNRQLQLTLETLHHRMPRNLTWSALDGDPRLLEENAEEHVRIADAIDRRDGERARELIMAHTQRAQELILLRFQEP
ncbi:DNA-binding GntR family transcriptional regulator [Thermocatellispora tengchongensis]|uniref:DNA-binding GntR family transcriptional regulator n=1 Tax=Thermocatellispora tengchongensis TaxID=1073253 RepID=A0A840PGF9_9ACTN|nr:GntR family transcriptional regulator [Thermocatellispora tengchongensis]MBB5137896.1 DNA-binding GntR family transcriptional regulator [Thermocatellispora tengchongensis]